MYKLLCYNLFIKFHKADIAPQLFVGVCVVVLCTIPGCVYSTFFFGAC